MNPVVCAQIIDARFACKIELYLNLVALFD